VVPRPRELFREASFYIKINISNELIEEDKVLLSMITQTTYFSPKELNILSVFSNEV